MWGELNTLIIQSAVYD